VNLLKAVHVAHSQRFGDSGFVGKELIESAGRSARVFGNCVGGSTFVTNFGENRVGGIEQLVDSALAAFLAAAGRGLCGRLNERWFFHELILALMSFTSIYSYYMTGISQAKVLRRTAFVTGATGLLGNNLVRALVARGVTVRALVRSRSKAEKQFPSLSMELVEGDINDPPSFARWLAGADIVFHTAAYFRDNYKGGRHWQQLYTTNVVGRARPLSAAYDAGVRRFVQTSSTGTWQQTLNEESEADKKLTAILKARSMRVLSAREASNQPRIAFLGARISPRSGWIDRIECEFREDLYRNERLDV
jgi:hypothetical protein